MSDTATVADETRTDATAANTPAQRTSFHLLDEHLRALRQARKEYEALGRHIHDAQEAIIKEMENAGLTRRVVDGDAFTIVRAVRRLIDGARAIPMLKRRGLYKKLTMVVVDEQAYRSLVDTNLFPELAQAIETRTNAPYVKIS
jgi:hypothetical protein